MNAPTSEAMSAIRRLRKIGVFNGRQMLVGPSAEVDIMSYPLVWLV
jgi:hypothetical protein